MQEYTVLQVTRSNKFFYPRENNFELKERELWWDFSDLIAAGSPKFYELRRAGKSFQVVGEVIKAPCWAGVATKPFLRRDASITLKVGSAVAASLPGVYLKAQTETNFKAVVQNLWNQKRENIFSYAPNLILILVPPVMSNTPITNPIIIK